MSTYLVRLHYLYVLLLISVVKNWLVPMRSSYWLDETVTCWAVEGGFTQMIARTYELHFLSVFYGIEWAVAKVFGFTEIALRLPSIIAIIATLFVLHRIAREFFDEETAVYAVILCAVHPVVIEQVSNARPYALGLLFSCVAMLYFVLYQQYHSTKYGLLFAMFAVISCYVHALFVQLLIPCATISLINLLRGKGPRLINTAMMWCCPLILLLPAIQFIYYPLLERGQSLVFSTSPSWSNLSPLIVPYIYLCSVVLGLIVFACMRLRDKTALDNHRCEYGVLTLWVTMPVIAFFLISKFTDIKIFVPRYLITVVPGICIILASLFVKLDKISKTENCENVSCLLSGLPSGRLLVLIILFYSIIVTDRSHKENWRDAIRFACDYIENTGVDTDVFVHTGMIESKQVEWLTDKAKSKYILAPLVAYRLNGKISPLPLTIDNETSRKYCTDLLKNISFDKCVFIGRSFDGSMRESFVGLAERSGFRATILYNKNNVRTFVILFEKKGVKCPLDS